MLFVFLFTFTPLEPLEPFRTTWNVYECVQVFEYVRVFQRPATLPLHNVRASVRPVRWIAVIGAEIAAFCTWVTYEPDALLAMSNRLLLVRSYW